MPAATGGVRVSFPIGGPDDWGPIACSPDLRTLATCSLYTDPGGHIPGWAMNRGTEQTLPYIFSGLRQHVRRSRYDHSC